MFSRLGITAPLALAASVLVWSTTFAGLRAVLEHFSPGHLLVVRWVLASAVLVGYGACVRMRLPSRGDVPAIALAGTLGFTVYQTALTWGQTGLSAGTAGLLVNLAPVFTVLLASALRYERIDSRAIAGLGVSLTGLLVLGSARDGLGGGPGHAALVVLAAFAFAGYVVASIPLLKRYSALEVTTYSMVAGTVPLLAFAPGATGALMAAETDARVALLYLALMPASLAYVTWSHALASMSASAATQALHLVPVLGLGVAYVWLGEVPGVLALAGGTAIIAGVTLASWPRRESQPVPALRSPVVPQPAGAVVVADERVA